MTSHLVIRPNYRKAFKFTLQCVSVVLNFLHEYEKYLQDVTTDKADKALYTNQVKAIPHLYKYFELH